MSASTALPRDPRLAQRNSYTWWLTERMRWSDTDQVGHINNVSFLTYCESGRTEFFREMLAWPEPADRPYMLISQINLSFIGELHWPGTVEVGINVLEIGNSSCRVGHGIFQGERCVATADSLLVNIDTVTRKARPIPAAAREHLGRYRVP